MSEFTKGKWEADALYGDHFAVFANSHVIADCFGNKGNARLMAAAPELYELLKEELIPTSDYGGILSFSREAKLRKLFARIDGKEEKA